MLVPKINILVCLHSTHRFNDQLNFCTLLFKADPSLNFLLVMDGKLGESYCTKLKNSGFNFEVIGSLKKENQLREEPIGVKSNLFNAFWKKIYAFLHVYLVYPLKEYRAIQSQYLLWQNQYLFLEKLNEKFKAQIIITNGDRNLGIEPAFLRLGKQKKIKIVVPYLVYSHEEAPLVLRMGNAYMQLFPRGPFLNNLIKVQYPNQFLRYKNDDLNYVFYAPSVFYALKKLGVLSSNPWYTGNGVSDYIVLDSEAAKLRYIENGVSSQKLSFLGDYAYDALFTIYSDRNSIKEKIAQKYQLDSSKPIWILALPQLAEHDLLDWPSHWKYQNDILTAVSQRKENILISLHPRMRKEQYEFLENDYQCKILEERLFDVLPIADCFLAGYSGTIRWAVLCGIQTIVVDFTMMKHKMFDDLESVKYALNNEELLILVQNIQRDNAVLKRDYKRLSGPEIFDGKTINRYIQLLYTI